MCKKNVVLFFILCISITGFSQEFPLHKTSKHQQVEGTSILIVPPDSFENSTNFKGFQDPKDPTAMIMVMEIPGPYKEVTKGFNADVLQTRGMTLRSKKDIKIGDYQGMLIKLDQPSNGMVFSKQLLIFGDEKSSTMVNGIYLQDSLQLGDLIKKSLLSTVIDSSLKSDPRESLNYHLDEKVGSLRFKMVIGNSMLFNRDLKTPTESMDKASLIVDKSFAKMEVKNKKQFCLSRIKNYPDDYSVLPSKGINELTIDGLTGYELYATNNDTPEEEMYQVILFDTDGGYYVFVGTYLRSKKEALVDIKNVIKTFKRR